MKRVLSLILMLAMLMSLSVCAFAAENTDPVIPEEDRDLEIYPMPKDVSVLDNEDGKVQLASLIVLPDPLKAAARKQIEKVIGMGYKIHSGFGVWTEVEDKTYCTVKLSLKDVPEGAVIFLNGDAIQPETRDNDGYDYFDAPLNTVPDKSIVLIAVREKKEGTVVGYTEIPGGGGGKYPSVGYTQP